MTVQPWLISEHTWTITKNERGIIVKRVICLIAVLCLLPICVFAEGIDFTVDMYNSMSYEFEAPKLPKDYETNIVKDGKKEYTFHVSDSIVISFTEKEGNIKLCAIICLSENAYLDFIPACICGAFALTPNDALLFAYDIVMKFYQVKAGKEPGTGYANNAVYEMFKMKNGNIAFIISLAN